MQSSATAVSVAVATEAIDCATTFRSAKATAHAIIDQRMVCGPRLRCRTTSQNVSTALPAADITAAAGDEIIYQASLCPPAENSASLQARQ